MKNDDFQDGKMVADGRFFNTYSIFDGGDLMKNDDFQEGKMVVVRRFLHTYSIFDGGHKTFLNRFFFMGVMFNRISNREMRFALTVFLNQRFSEFRDSLNSEIL